MSEILPKSASHRDTVAYLVSHFKVRKTDKILAMADILRIADFSPGVSRYALIQGKLNIARRYHSKTIDRALKMLVKANFLTSTGASGKTNGELYSRRI